MHKVPCLLLCIFTWMLVRSLYRAEQRRQGLVTNRRSQACAETITVVTATEVRFTAISANCTILDGPSITRFTIARLNQARWQRGRGRG